MRENKPLYDRMLTGIQTNQQHRTDLPLSILMEKLRILLWNACFKTRFLIFIAEHILFFKNKIGNWGVLSSNWEQLGVLCCGGQWYAILKLVKIFDCYSTDTMMLKCWGPDFCYLKSYVVLGSWLTTDLAQSLAICCIWGLKSAEWFVCSGWKAEKYKAY